MASKLLQSLKSLG
jgi:hypothetical protein